MQGERKGTQGEWRGDFTRDTFDPRKHFSRVLMQQGRVQLDADWNEQTSILLHYLRTLAKDLIGPHGGPSAYQGFEIITSADNKAHPYHQQEISEGGFGIGPGRYYVRGILVENEYFTTYGSQPGYPFDDKTQIEDLKCSKEPFLVYLDVWERHITYIDEESIREVALGGPDTATRAQVVWQVRVYLDKATCEATTDLPSLGTGRLKARVYASKVPDGPCIIPPESRYRGTENHLYRVEIHQAGGTAAYECEQATFKWSRENASVAFAVLKVEPEPDDGRVQVTLSGLGRDTRSGLEIGDWVELLDDDYVVGNSTEDLLEVVDINPELMTVTLKGVTRIKAANQKHPLLRRWDHQGNPHYGGAIAVEEGKWIALEDGIQIWFAKDGEYRTGDYWLIPARVATGDIEWPGPSNDPLLQPPHGIKHYYAPLAILQWNGTDFDRQQDCRKVFSPLPEAAITSP